MINDSEMIDKLMTWQFNHDCSIGYEGAIGGKYTYVFTPTSLGMVTKVVCACGKEIDLTDYKNW